MKKISLAILFALSCFSALAGSDSTHAYERRAARQPYFRLGAGYGFGLSSDITTTTKSVKYAGTKSEQIRYSQENVSFGKGMSGTAAMGYYLGKCLALEAAISTGFSGSAPVARFTTDTSNYTERLRSVPATTLQLNMLIHSPAQKTQVYARAGLVASFAGKITSTLEGTPRLGTTAKQTMELQHKAAFGFSGALGVRREVSPNVRLWIEAGTLMLAPFLDKLTIKDLEVNGTNVTRYMTADDATQKYDFSGTTTKDFEGATPTSSDPFSNAGFNAGVTFDIERHASEKEAAANRGFYLSAAFTFLAPLASKTASIDGSSVVTSSFGATIANEQKFDSRKASYSTGIAARAGVGYMFNPYIGVECDGWLGLRSKQYSYVSEKYLKSGSYSILDKKTVTNSRAQAPLLLIPALFVTTGQSRVSGHIRAGLVLPVRTIILLENEEYLPSVSSTTAYRTGKAKLTTNFVLGSSVAVGATTYLAPGVRLVTEVSALSYAPSAKSATLTELKQSGLDILTQVPVAERTTTYAKAGTYGAGTSAGSTIHPSFTLPFSCIGATVGLNIAL
ncbi:MAG: hypothetical protein KF744_02740 [Taibaiella sp.]|nr:hypothetical protein [Taibaiella sp.]